MSDWQELTLAEGLTLTVPADLSRGPEQGVDTAVATWNGAGISVVIDQGPFADPLTTYQGRPGSRSRQETIDGRLARIVSFVEGNGTRVVAAHFPGARAGASAGKGAAAGKPLTIVVRVDPAVLREEVAFDIIRSLRFGGR
jgi:hypothetical protein